MSIDLPTRFDEATARLRDLALKRHVYYLDLLQSGRWRRYFSEADFAARLRDVMRATVLWNRHADGESRAVAPEKRRSAA